MRDQELKALLESQNADLRQHMDAVAEKLRGELTGRIDGLDQRVDSLGQRIDGLDRRFDGLHRHFDSVAEDMDSRFSLMAEAMSLLDEKLDRNVGTLRDEMARGFKDTHDLIRFAYTDLDRRKH